MTVPYERLIAFEAAFNFRDLGGYETAGGYQVRWRRVFRSAELNGMTPADILLARELGLRSVFDLRSPYELDERGIGTLFDGELVHHRHTPFFRDVTAPATRDLDLDMVAVYRLLLAIAQPAISEIFVTLADEGTYPAVIHCVAGKDRTGLVSALLLRTLNVDDATIAADYALSGEYITPRLEALRTAQSSDRYGEIPPHTLRADPETILQTLDTLDQEYGSARGYLLGCGVSDAQLDAIRRHLLQ